MIKKLMMSGLVELNKVKLERERAKVNVHRGGSAGCYVDGKWYGSCPRITLLRYVGVEKVDSFDDYLCYCAGFGHETNLVNLITNSPEVDKVHVWDKPDYYTVNNDKLVYHDTSIYHEIEGVEFSGRPDLVIEKNGVQIGIEAKALIGRKRVEKAGLWPFTTAICQSVAYSKVLNIPYHIVYGSYSFYDEFTFKPIKDKLDFIEYRQFPKGTYIKVPTNIFEYEVIITDKDRVAIKDINGVVRETILTGQGVFDYYAGIADCANNKSMPDRPEDYELTGKGSYNKCDYCDNKEICNAIDNNIITYDEFVATAKANN